MPLTRRQFIKSLIVGTAVIKTVPLVLDEASIVTDEQFNYLISRPKNLQVVSSRQMRVPLQIRPGAWNFPNGSYILIGENK